MEGCVRRGALARAALRPGPQEHPQLKTHLVEGTMRDYEVPVGFAGVRSSFLILSLLISAALTMLHALPCSSADTDDVISSAERHATPGAATNREEVVRVRLSETYGKLPLRFEANRGQTDPEVRFLARSGRHAVFLTST